MAAEILKASEEAINSLSAGATATYHFKERYNEKIFVINFITLKEDRKDDHQYCMARDEWRCENRMITEQPPST
jgi:hypothetical protein